MKLSVVIINWNIKELLHTCLVSLVEEIKSIKHEIILVDNASEDGSQEMIKKKFPGIDLIENKENVGFPRANNQVLSKCRGEYVMLLNPDTFIRPNSILRMVTFLDANKEYGAVGPKILRPDGSIQMECACNFPTLAGMFFELTLLSRLFSQSPLFGQWRMTYWDHQDSRDIECLLGAAIFMRRKILDVIGFLDEHMYIEDDDLCYRIIKEGWKIKYLSTAEIIHYEGSSRKSSSQFYHHYQIAWHGLWHFFNKHQGSFEAMIFRVITFICASIGMTVFFLAAWSTLLRKETSSSFRNKGRKALATFLWSITPARRFEAKY